ncbi:MAG: thiamine phosphate synthase [Desulfovibrionaceae bacterium]
MNPRLLAALSVYLVTDRPLCLGRPLDEVVFQAVAGGCTMVQLREKTTDTREFVELARALRARLAPLGVPLLINDRVDVALAAGVDGVHVGQSDMRPADVRRLMGPDVIVGLSAESLETLRAAQDEPVDYLGVGPAYPTSTKKDVKGSPWGPEGYARAVAESRLPVVAIGGIDAPRARAVMASGVAGVAVVSCICSAPSPEAAARELAAAVARGRAGR